MGVKKPIQVYLRPDQIDALRVLARDRGVSIAELVRRGVDRLLQAAEPSEEPLLSLIGSSTGPKDLADRHDDYLVESISTPDLDDGQRDH